MANFVRIDDVHYINKLFIVRIKKTESPGENGGEVIFGCRVILSNNDEKAYTFKTKKERDDFVFALVN